MFLKLWTNELNSVIIKYMNHLEKKLGYEFKNKQLLVQALTHSSYSHENPSYKDNERLEFLGDAILDLVISDILFKRLLSGNEGILSQVRSCLVRATTLADIAIDINLNEEIIMGRGANNDRNNVSILSGTLEAVLGAIYLDNDYESAFSVINNIFTIYIENAINNQEFDNKSKLQELVQSISKSTPVYNLSKIEGPDHCKVFFSEVKFNGRCYGIGKGNSRKESEQAAAKLALEHLN